MSEVKSAMPIFGKKTGIPLQGRKTFCTQHTKSSMVKSKMQGFAYFDHGKNPTETVGRCNLDLPTFHHASQWNTFIRAPKRKKSVLFLG
jgi:hypothetical protein